jgi:type IV pilus assembly protein PilV
MITRSYPRPRKTRGNRPTGQHGIVLLEALCGLLIFMVGILGLIGLQAASVKQATAAEYRSVAALQANELISNMWVSDRTAAVLQARFASPDGPGYAAWRDKWKTTLPGAADKAPEVTFTSIAGGGASPTSSSQVEIVVYWLAPGDDATKPHKYSVLAQLK